MQALILVDFLLSLTPKAKKKLEGSTNKSVLYSYTLSEDDVRQCHFNGCLDIKANTRVGYMGDTYEA